MINIPSHDIPAYTECPSWKHFDHEDNEREEVVQTEEYREGEEETLG